MVLELLMLFFHSNGTSMISLIIPPKDQISRVAKMLADEFGTASNIKSRVNRLSVLGAITSVQQRLKLYNKGNLELDCFLPLLCLGYIFHFDTVMMLLVTSIPLIYFLKVK